MAKRKARRIREEQPEQYSLQQMSLEDILEEYRAQTEAAAPPEPESYPLTLEPEPDGVASAEVTEPEEEAPAYPEAEPDGEGSPEEEEEHASVSELPPEEPAAEEPAGEEKSSVPLEMIEGFDEEDDFYAGAVEEGAFDDGEEEPLPLGDPELPPDIEEETKKKRAADKNKRRRPFNPLSALRGGLVGLLAASSWRREQARTQPPPEPEDAELEMEPRKAAKHYASQMPSLKLRTIMAAVMTLFLAWLSLSVGFGWPLPGSLSENLRAVSLVCLSGQVTVMLLGLDIVTSGVMSLSRGRAGAESMIALSGLTALIDTAVVALTGNLSRGLPFAVLPAAAMTFALWGAWFTGRGFYDSFMTYYRIDEPNTVSSEELPGREYRGLIVSRREGKGFIRRSEEPSLAESIASRGFLPMAAGAFALALAIALGSGDMGAFFHLLALTTGLCASFGWLFSYPLLFARTARHLMLDGSVLAGWTGAREIGRSGQLVIKDTDVFPTDTMEITGIRLLDKSNKEKIIGYTGSMLSTAGTGFSAVFTELMRRRNAVLRQVENFTVGEGGAKGVIEGAEVRVGTSGYMHLSGVKIPEKLRTGSALFSAIDGELAGVFLFRYRPEESVRRALLQLHRARRKPIFAVRDFSIDPLMIRREFDVPTDGFQFPIFQERYELSAVGTEEGGPAAGITGREGLDALVELSESGRSLYRIGTVCAWACLVCTVLGAALIAAPCWLGRWELVSAGRVLLYMLLWVLPPLAGSLLLRR